MTTHERAMERELWRADCYRVLALGFSAPSRAQREQLLSVCAELTTIETADAVIGDAVARLAATMPDDLATWQAEYHRLFTTDVACPSSEGSYHRTERGPILGDVAAFYAAFRVGPIPQEGPLDGLKIELTFLQYLALKKVYAMSGGMMEEAEITEDATRKFLLDHLGRWVEPFVTRLHAATLHPFYRSAGALLRQWMVCDCETLGVTPTTLTGENLDDTDTTPVCCSV